MLLGVPLAFLEEKKLPERLSLFQGILNLLLLPLRVMRCIRLSFGSEGVRASEGVPEIEWSMEERESACEVVESITDWASLELRRTLGEESEVEVRSVSSASEWEMIDRVLSVLLRSMFLSEFLGFLLKIVLKAGAAGFNFAAAPILLPAVALGCFGRVPIGAWSVGASG